MPKKTKRAKLRADARRKASRKQTQSGTAEHSGSVTPAPPANSATYSLAGYRPQEEAKMPAKPLQLSETDEAEFRAIHKDLIKTIAMAATAFLVELILYWKFGSI